MPPVHLMLAPPPSPVSSPPRSFAGSSSLWLGSQLSLSGSFALYVLTDAASAARAHGVMITELPDDDLHSSPPVCHNTTAPSLC